MQPILVTGATGTLGRAVLPRLIAAGHGVRALSRRPPASDPPGGVEWVVGDLDTGAGLADAVRDVAAIIHCATDARAPKRDMLATRNLIEAAASARPHLVYISIVGVDRVPLGYYQVKRQVESLVERSGLGWTILRTTQFHDLVLMLMQLLARSPVMPVPAGVSVQPVDVGEVAERLVQLALAGPAGRVPDLGGPAVRTAGELARAYLRASGRRRVLLPTWLPGRTFRAYRRGGHLTPEHADGRRSFEEYLAEHVGRG
jgi:uncharacterized protein YbjT (DUF2867 family)